MQVLQRKWTILSLIVITPIGFYTKMYSGPAAGWVNNHFGGVLYVIFWSLLIFLSMPNLKPLNITLIVLVLTCLIEFLQLWSPPFLQLLRSYFIGQTILGASFSWIDMAHYSVGFVLALLLIKLLARHELLST